MQAAQPAPAKPGASPTVAMPKALITSSPNLPPSWRSLGTGSGPSRCGTAAAGTTVCCMGLCSPEPSLAKIL
jgi:hypothetical protein